MPIEQESESELQNFIYVIDNLLTPEECSYFINYIENKDNKHDIIDHDLANYERVTMINKKFAKELFERLKNAVPDLPSQIGYEMIMGLNDHFRFSKYIPGGQFKIHKDSINVAPDGTRALMTLNVFLNKPDKGGSTIFYDESFHCVKTVEPLAGRGVLFYNQIYHEGSVVEKGIKYLIRTDVMSRTVF